VGVQVVDGHRGTQTWADELALPAKAWHATATVVVGRLARALRFELNDLASQETAAATSDAEAQARAFAAQAWVQLFARAQTPDTNRRAMRLARSAVALAPELSQGWMCLAYADWRAGQYRWSDEPRDELMARAVAETERPWRSICGSRRALRAGPGRAALPGTAAASRRGLAPLPSAVVVLRAGLRAAGPGAGTARAARRGTGVMRPCFRIEPSGAAARDLAFRAGGSQPGHR
jgi:hypothetical protein